VKKLDLVEIKNGKVYCTSLSIAEEFKISHPHVLEKIRNLTIDIPTAKSEFKEGFFINERNREYPLFHITRRGYMSLIMNLDAKSKESKLILMQKKELFIE
jgi:phage regulator Rha-like protein